MGKTRIINRGEVEALLTMEDCVAAMAETLAQVSKKEAAMTQRGMLPAQAGNMFAVMQACNVGQSVCGAKVIMFPGREAKERGTNQGIIPLFDTETGSLKAIVDAECITAVRTAAASGAATQALAREDAHVLAILGAGRIGRLHVEAIRGVRPVDRVLVWNRTAPRAEECCQWVREQFGIEAQAFEDAGEAVRQADIVCTVTSAKEPVLLGEWLKEGTHINAVGACSAAGRELDTLAVAKSRVFADQMEAVLRDGGDVLIPVNNGELSKGHVAGEVGEVLLKRLEGRQDDSQITMFESVGIAVEDLAAANLIYKKAVAQGIGIEVEI